MKNCEYMQQALQLANQAYALGEVPIGALIVYGGEVIATAHNRVESDQTVLGHAELLCIAKASSRLKAWRLNGADVTLYTTLEPCMMCMGAIGLSRVNRVVYGAKRERDRVEFPPHVEAMGGVCEEECQNILKRFFAELRAQKTT